MTITAVQPYSGGCQCGAIRYEIAAPPTDAYYCHCRLCQRAGGAPVNATARFPADAFRLLRGEPKFYAALEHGSRGFCADCGSPLLYRPAAALWQGAVFVRIASLDDPARVTPRWHCGVESRIPWFTTGDDLPETTSEANLEAVALEAPDPPKPRN